MFEHESYGLYIQAMIDDFEVSQTSSSSEELSKHKVAHWNHQIDQEGEMFLGFFEGSLY